MRKLGILAVLPALLLLSSPVATAKTDQNAPAIAGPALTCKVSKVVMTGKTFKADGGCKLGAKPVAAKLLKWTWTQKFWDLSRVACDVGTATGSGKSFPLKVNERLPPGARLDLPGILEARFTVSTRQGKKVVRSPPKTLRKLNPESRMLCGAQMPRLVSPAAAEPATCSWATDPAVDSSSGFIVLKAAAVECPGSSQCQWRRNPAQTPYQYLTFGSARIECADGLHAQIGLGAYYWAVGAKVHECYAEVPSVSSFTVSKRWGPGQMRLYAAIHTWIGNTEMPKSPAIWYGDGYMQGKGTESPCSTDFKE